MFFSQQHQRLKSKFFLKKILYPAESKHKKPLRILKLHSLQILAPYAYYELNYVCMLHSRQILYIYPDVNNIWIRVYFCLFTFFSTHKNIFAKMYCHSLSYIYYEMMNVCMVEAREKITSEIKYFEIIFDQIFT